MASPWPKSKNGIVGTTYCCIRQLFGTTENEIHLFEVRAMF